VQDDPTLDEKCGTHVHISIAPTSWEKALGILGGPGPLKRLALAVLYFERCVDALMPPSRLNNRYCRSNYASFHDREVLPYPPNFPGIPNGKEDLDHARDMLEEATSALHVQFPGRTRRPAELRRKLHCCGPSRANLDSDGTSFLSPIVWVLLNSDR
jgi:hypothetical protein